MRVSAVSQEGKRDGMDWEIESRHTVLRAKNLSHRCREQNCVINDELVNAPPLAPSFRAIACTVSTPLLHKKISS